MSVLPLPPTRGVDVAFIRAASGTCRNPGHCNGQHWCCRRAPQLHRPRIVRPRTTCAATRGGRHETSAQNFPAPCSECCRVPGCFVLRLGTNLSGAAGAVDRWLSTRWLGGHHRASYKSMAVGAARPAIYHRQPAGRRWQHRNRGGRERTTGRPYASFGRHVTYGQCDAL
jgi:hypothetical protein